MGRLPYAEASHGNCKREDKVQCDTSHPNLPITVISFPITEIILYFTNRLMVCMSSLTLLSPSRRRIDSLTQVLIWPLIILSET